MSRKIISLVLSICFLFQQTGLVQAAAVELNLSNYFARMASTMAVDTFRPIHLRYFSYDSLNNSFKVLLDKGTEPKQAESQVKEETKELLKYFLIGVTLPNDKFWVNLRPDSPKQIIDFNLEETDIGKIMLEADLQLKKDTAFCTSPQTPEGKEYWSRLYKKAEELYGNENITIPTLTRPWIVPNEIIVREAKDSAYIYKATLKVMLEQDYLKDSATYNFQDSRAKALNEYSSQLIRELIIPKLTKEVNLSKRYAPLRQVYYSLILSRWFKSRFYGKSGVYASLIDKNDLSNLTSKATWDKSTYFNAYKKSFAEGEYNIKEPVYTPSGQSIRSYFSGGIQINPPNVTPSGFTGASPVLNKVIERNLTPVLGNPRGDLKIGNPETTQVAGSPIKNTRNNILRTNLINGLSKQAYPLNSTLPEVLQSWFESIIPPFEKYKLSFSEEDIRTILKAFIFAANSMKTIDMEEDPNHYIEKANESITEYLNKPEFNGRLNVHKIKVIKDAALAPFKYIRADMTLLPDKWTVQKMVQMSDAISGVVRTALDIAAGATPHSASPERQERGGSSPVKAILRDNSTMPIEIYNLIMKRLEIVLVNYPHAFRQLSTKASILTYPMDNAVIAYLRGLGLANDFGVIDQDASHILRLAVKEHGDKQYLVSALKDEGGAASPLVEADIFNDTVRKGLKALLELTLIHLTSPNPDGETGLPNEQELSDYIEYLISDLHSYDEQSRKYFGSSAKLLQDLWEEGMLKVLRQAPALCVKAIMLFIKEEGLSELKSKITQLNYGVAPEKLIVEPAIKQFDAEKYLKAVWRKDKEQASSPLNPIEHTWPKIKGYLVIVFPGDHPYAVLSAPAGTVNKIRVKSFARKYWFNDSALLDNFIKQLYSLADSPDTFKRLFQEADAGFRKLHGKGNLWLIDWAVGEKQKQVDEFLHKIREGYKTTAGFQPGDKFTWPSILPGCEIKVSEINGNKIKVHISATEAGFVGHISPERTFERNKFELLLQRLHSYNASAAKLNPGNESYKGLVVLARSLFISAASPLRKADIFNDTVRKGLKDLLKLALIRITSLMSDGEAGLPNEQQLSGYIEYLISDLHSYDEQSREYFASARLLPDLWKEGMLKVLRQDPALCVKAIMLFIKEEGISELRSRITQLNYDRAPDEEAIVEPAIKRFDAEKYLQAAWQQELFNPRVDPRTIMHVERISRPYWIPVNNKDELSKIVEKPLLEAAQILYSKGIQMYSTSANKRDLEFKPIKGDGNSYAHIAIPVNGLSETNKAVISGLFSGAIKYKNKNIKMAQATPMVEQDMDYFQLSLAYILMPITEKTTIEEIREESIFVANQFVNQVSSPVGGIDFKHQALSSATSYEAMGSFSGLDFSLPKLSSQALLSFNLDKEQSDISQAIDNGILVSGERIKEFMAASSAKGELEQRRETVITWLAKLGILEETTCCTQESSPEYREALVIADSAVI